MTKSATPAAEQPRSFIDPSLPNLTPPPWIPFYIPSQGWAACWKGPKSAQGVGPDSDLYPICHMRWTDGLRPEIEERLENEIRLICRSVNQSAGVAALADAFSDAVGILKNCTCQQVDAEVLKRIRAALAQLDRLKGEG